MSILEKMWLGAFIIVSIFATLTTLSNYSWTERNEQLTADVAEAASTLLELQRSVQSDRVELVQCRMGWATTRKQALMSVTISECNRSCLDLVFSVYKSVKGTEGVVHE